MQQIEFCFVDSCWMRYSNYKYTHRWKYDKDHKILLSFCGTIKRTGDLKDFLLSEDLSYPRCKSCLKVRDDVCGPL